MDDRRERREEGKGKRVRNWEGMRKRINALGLKSWVPLVLNVIYARMIGKNEIFVIHGCNV